VRGSTPSGRRTLTPAVLASALFTAACAVFAITFVAARGGLSMPLAPTRSPVALASQGPSAPPSMTAPPTAAPTASPAPTVLPTAVPTLVPTDAPSATPAGSPDPLTALPACPGLPGCYQYLIRRGDTLSGVATRYSIEASTVLALNPEIIDPGTIIVGEVLYLGRDPFLRLEPCPDTPDCSLYVVRPGDRLSTIAGRFGMTVENILEANPAITDPNAIYSGQAIRLPRAAS
jgi:nucleoid-associated protein YgaU